MPEIATAGWVARDALREFLRPRHQAVLLTRRRSGGPRRSPVTCGLDAEGRIVVPTCPRRSEVANGRPDPDVSLTFLCITTTAWGPGGFGASRRRRSTSPEACIVKRKVSDLRDAVCAHRGPAGQPPRARPGA